MRRILIGIAGLALFAMQADAMGPATDWAGVYKTRFANGNVDGEKYQSEDIMEIVTVDDTHAYVRLALEFYNGHTCSFAAVFSSAPDALTYHGDQADFGVEPCTLSVRREVRDEGTRLMLDDKDSNCRAVWCGMRGRFTGESWPFSARREIHYMDRLKASVEYKEAIAKAGSSATAKP